MKYFSFAWKNLQRRRGRTILTVAGVAISIAVLFSLLAFNAGYERELTNEMEGMGFHLLAVPKGCPYEAASLIIHGGMIPKYLSDADLAEARAIPGIDIASPMLLHQFMKDGAPQIVYGIDPGSITRLKPHWTVDGRLFTGDESRVVVVGRSLAGREGLAVGSLLPLGPDAEPFTVVGVLDETGGQDDDFYFLPLREAQRLSGNDGKITAIAITVDDLAGLRDVSKALEGIPDIQVVSMAQVTGTIMNLVGSARTLLLSVIAIAVLVSAFGIMNTLMMSVSERRAEFGMLKAVGASGWNIGLLVLIETLLVTFAGGVAGVALALVGSGGIEFFVRAAIPYAPAGRFLAPDPGLIVFCIVFAVALGLVCGIYPAYRSSRLSPMEAIRSDVN